MADLDLHKNLIFYPGLKQFIVFGYEKDKIYEIIYKTADNFGYVCDIYFYEESRDEYIKKFTDSCVFVWIFMIKGKCFQKNFKSKDLLLFAKA